MRYELRFGVFRWLLTLIGTGPRVSSATTGAERLEVRMGWAFRAVVPRSSVAGARRDRDMRWGIGVHGWNGRWLVNGSVRGIVTVDIDPPCRARVLGFPVHLRQLHLSMVDPEGFLVALGTR